MLEILKAPRPAECLLAGTLGLVGFVHAGIAPDWQALTTLCLIVAATMLQNDWRDRFHDLDKGKTLAVHKPKLFMAMLVITWLASAIGILLVEEDKVAYLLALIALVGVVYSESRGIPLLPLFIVSVMSATPLLLPLALGGRVGTIAVLFLATVSILCGRETLHDIADRMADIGYKKTLPIVAGTKVARNFAAVMLAIGCCAAIVVSTWCAVGALFVAWGLSDVLKEEDVKTVRMRVDAGMVLMVLALLK